MGVSLVDFTKLSAFVSSSHVRLKIHIWGFARGVLDLWGFNRGCVFSPFSAPLATKLHSIGFRNV